MAFQKVLLGRDLPCFETSCIETWDPGASFSAEHSGFGGVECVQLFNVTGMSQNWVPPQKTGTGWLMVDICRTWRHTASGWTPLAGFDRLRKPSTAACESESQGPPAARGGAVAEFLSWQASYGLWVDVNGPGGEAWHVMFWTWTDYRMVPWWLPVPLQEATGLIHLSEMDQAGQGCDVPKMFWVLHFAGIETDAQKKVTKIWPKRGELETAPWNFGYFVKRWTRREGVGLFPSWSRGHGPDISALSFLFIGFFGVSQLAPKLGYLG